MDLDYRNIELKKLYNSQKGKSFSDLYYLYELNFIKLLQLFPNLESISEDLVIKSNEKDLHLMIEEKTKHTATMILTHKLMEESGKVINKPDIKFKIYFDAEMTEVISICKEQMLNANHSFISYCGDIDLKWELNLFLERWLDFCLSSYKSNV